MTATDIRNLRRVSYQLVEAEERNTLIRNLISHQVGFREEEEFRRKEGNKLKGGRGFDKKKATVMMAMREKQKDNFKYEGKLRRLRNKTIRTIEDRLGRNTSGLRRIMTSIKNGTKVVRKRTRDKFKKKEKFLVGKYGMKDEVMLPDLSGMDKSKYEGCKIFNAEYDWRTEEAREISVVCKPGQGLMIDEDEQNLLKLGPKFSILTRLDDERFENELEQAIMKMRWDKMGIDDENKKKSESDAAIELVLDEEQVEECREYEEMIEARTRMIYDVEGNNLDFTRRRTTDLKNNARVVFPKSDDFSTEAKFELLRLEAMGEFKRYVAEKCRKGGKQTSNLTKSEESGLKKLKKRVNEGEIVVLPTDKTGNFAVMDRTSYEEAGRSHIKQDKEVGWEDMKLAQRELNGHIAMAIKIFKIGSNWGHEARVRETMMGESLESCPVHLLYKDHKGWSQDKGGVPPTRSVAGGNRGINLHLSEIVSDVLEPMVGRVTGGYEVISTEDTLARLEDVSESMRDWTPSSWWEGRVFEGWTACSKCVSLADYVWNEDKPSLCRCVDKMGKNDTVDLDEEILGDDKVEVGQIQEGEKLEVGQLQGGETLEVGQTQKGDALEVGQLQGGDMLEDGQIQEGTGV